MEAVFDFLCRELKQSTRSSEKNCQEVAGRLDQEVARICQDSQRILDSGEVETLAMSLAKHRLERCLKYYNLGSHQGRIELHSTLSAIVYRYISPTQSQASYQARLTLIEDFLQGFYVEAVNAFRRENQLAETYQPRTLLELSEYMAFTERYGKRRIPLPRRRGQQLIILRAQTFSKQQPRETLVDIEQATESPSSDGDAGQPPSQRLREQLVAQGNELPEDSLRGQVVEALMTYLKERKQEDCAEYFTLRLLDLPTQDIAALLDLTPRQRDYLQQRFKYHLLRFALSHEWELVHEWLEADLERNLGLTAQQWETLQQMLTPRQAKLLDLKHQGMSEADIARIMGLTSTQMNKQWAELLEQAWNLRNP